MADILIKGLKLPEGANELRLIIHPNGQVIISKQTYLEETEAIEIPDHGRLIDADALKQKWIFRGEAERGYQEEIDDAPTIIPAEEGEDGH